MAEYTGDDEVLQIFYAESKEHLDGMEDDLLALEKQGVDFDSDLVNRIFRAVHTIKGGCGFFGLEKLSSLSHSMENILDRIRKKELDPNTNIINSLLRGADHLKGMVNDPDSTDSINIEPDLAAFKKILSGSFSKEEKKSLKENTDIKLPDGRVIFTVNKYDFERAKKAEKGGNHVYLIEYDLIHDIERKGKTPWSVIDELLQLAVFIDSKVDIDGVGELSGDGMLKASIPFYALISTIIETDLIYDFLGLDSSKVHLISDSGEITDASQASAQSESFAPMPEIAAKREEPVTEVLPEVNTAAPGPAASPPPPLFSVAEKANETPPEIKDIKKSAVETSSVRVNVTLLDKLMSLAGELVLARNQLIQSTTSKEMESINNSTQRIDLITAELQEAIMATRMQAIGIVFHKFTRIVRDMARDLNKEVRLVLDGEEVELDKSIIESIGDPLTHLVRNSLDHGIEMPAIREGAGKNKQGTLRISAFHEAGHVIIKIADDGAGIRLDKVKAKALAQGLCTQDQLESMSEKEIVKFIFRPGFSTAEKVTDISGRGVGMDVVHTNLTKLGGTVDIDTVVGSGTTITIKLPLTLAIIPSLLLSVAAERFAIPQVNLVELVRISSSDAHHKIEKIGDAMVMRLRGHLLPLIKLSDVIDDKPVSDYKNPAEFIGLDPELDGTKVINIAVVQAGSLLYGLIVDSLLDSCEIVVKPLGRHLKKCKAYAAATILGDGRVALILDLIGISQMMELTEIGSEETEEASSEAVVDENTDHRDKQTLLIVHNGENEPFGIPLGLVARIEKIKSADIENIGGRKAIKYRDGILPLFALEEAANVMARGEAETLVVVVFKAGGREVGLMLSDIVDIVETDAKVDDATYKQPGIFGSAVINSRITLLIDLYGLVYHLMPHWRDEKGREVNIQPETVRDHTPTVLIAEDSKFFMSQLRGFMEEAGYIVLTAEDGAVALNVLNANSADVDIVLTDIEMPNLDGFEFTEKARADGRFAKLPILAVTSIAGSAAEMKGKQVGLDEYLIKLDRDEILERCSHYLKNGRRQE
ncbi:MAG: hypothetical protein A2017_14575 [Lentisphaerae bacterium GWF2_44_16]|nr:MAG: hypothetical protein A2017_14575 [Lentisphaerae bacterium GWF2_44_16]